MVGRYTLQVITVAFVMPTLYLVYLLAFGDDTSDAIIRAPLLYCMIPISVTFGWMWLGDSPGRYINMPSVLPEEELDRFARYYGIWGIAASVIMSLGMCLIVNGEFVLGLLLVFAPIAMFIYPMRYHGKGIGDRRIPLEGITGGRRFLMTVAVASMTLVPFVVTDNIDMSASGSVTVEFGDESFTIRAPMFDETFRYEDVDHVEYVEDFDKGSRKWGYATSQIASGKFHNDMFGDYRLASYVKVKPCVTFSVGGDMYAFNQHDATFTQKAYIDLMARLI